MAWATDQILLLWCFSDVEVFGLEKFTGSLMTQVSLVSSIGLLPCLA